jgi:16S rRNA (adenine1518-N6/adenine1519-N6)-dimethyltransferase
MLLKTQLNSYQNPDKVTAKKKFGQNFLHNSSIQKRFSSTVQAIVAKTPSINSIIEVGPGMGAITQHLAELNLPITAYEIDIEAISYLARQPYHSKLQLLNQDFLDVLKSGVTTKDYVFVSNLPFNVGSRILIDLTLQEYVPPLVVVLQKEVIEKIIKQVDFTLFGAWLSMFYDFSKITDISPGSFNPAPRVTSTLVQGIPLGELPKLGDRKQLLSLLKQLVRFPSKTLSNNLKGILEPEEISQFLSSLNLPITTRLGWANYQEVMTRLLNTTL